MIRSPNLHSLDLTNCTQLKNLAAYENINLSSVKLANHPNFYSAQLEYCNLSEIDLSGSPNLKYLRINYNKFTKAPALPLGLSLLDISGNSVPDLDLSKHLELGTLHCASCQIPVLDLTKHTELGELNCSGNPITELDLRYTKLFAIGGDDSGNSVAVYKLWCASPTLKKLYLRPGWGFYGITDTRKDEYIHPNTEIIFMDID